MIQLVLVTLVNVWFVHKLQPQPQKMAYKYSRLLCHISLFCLILSMTFTDGDGFIFWKAHSTACEMEICDDFYTNSGRNVACCFLFSKCCGFKNLDEAEAFRANQTTPAP
ncbi:hypothetical protein BLOT_010487 [Blomia tropicalis]|nr:hypothetical protein BLOT_010487 [Blomia tropicalis]